MKITFDSKIKEQKINGKFVPFIAKYDKDIYVLVTGPSVKGTSPGIMINGNRSYAPFEYSCAGWESDSLTPFDGVLTIECP